VVLFLPFRAFAAAIAAAADDEAAAASAVLDADWVAGVIRVDLVDEATEGELVEDDRDEVGDGEGEVEVANVLLADVACSLETTSVAISRA
jgi:hypothetical protein